MKTRIAVVGAGSWGNTLAILLAKKDYDVTMWCYDKKQYQEMVRDRQNPAYLPGIDFPDNLKLTDTLSRDLLDCPFVVFAVPTHAMRQTCQNVAGMLRPDSIMVNVSKGIENDSLKRMSEIISETLDIPASRIATLYGPSHAEEVSKGIATAVVSASPDLETARAVRDLFSTDYFRVYSSTDIIGVEVGGSLKNVIAIAAGICDGAGFGDNTKAALLTRGLAEMARLGEELGARPETFAGLSGNGDLIVTCMSKHSRNRYVGEEIGRGRTLSEVLDGMVMIAEGVKTTRSVHQLIEKYGVEMPISEQVFEVLFHDKSPRQAVAELMGRDPKEE